MIVGIQGYTSTRILRLVPTLTYRSLDYWVRTGVVRPSIQPAEGSGSLRVFSHDDLLMLRRIARLRAAGVEMSMIRRALHEQGSLEPLLVELDAAMEDVRVPA